MFCVTPEISDKCRRSVPLRESLSNIAMAEIAGHDCVSYFSFQSSLCAQWIAKDLRFLHADSEDSDQTRRMPRLTLVFAVRTLILLVLSCRGSTIIWKCNAAR